MLIVQMPIMFYVFTKGQKQITMYVYIQIAIYWLDPPNTDRKQICLQICANGGVCRIAKIA